jgi:hypothetical protein
VEILGRKDGQLRDKATKEEKQMGKDKGKCHIIKFVDQKFVDEEKKRKFEFDIIKENKCLNSVKICGVGSKE